MPAQRLANEECMDQSSNFYARLRAWRRLYVRSLLREQEVFDVVTRSRLPDADLSILPPCARMR
jgi:hypothetical protein